MMNERGSYLCQLTDDEIYDANIFCDASGMGYGGYITNEAGYIDENSCMFGNWSIVETMRSSTWRELEAVKRMVKNRIDKIKGKSISIHTDNKNVDAIIGIGSRKHTLQDINIEIHNTCEENNVRRSSKWIPRENNTRADNLSRFSDCDDWEVQSWVFAILDSKWGKHTYDRFASYYNRKCDKFNSKFGAQVQAV